MHERGDDGDERSAPIAPAPAVPAVIMPCQSRQASRSSWRANQASVPGAHSAAVLPDRPCSSVSTSARKMSSRLRPPAPAWPRSSSSVPSAISRPAGDHADALGHALGDLEDVGGHDDRAAGRDPLAQHRP